MNAVELDHVSKAFGRRQIISDVSLAVETGAAVGIVGSNGSGKSVLFQLICGFLPPDSGAVRIRGARLGPERDFPEGMGVLINSPGFIGPETGLANLRYLAGIRGRIGDGEIREALRKVGLDPEDRTRVEHYSLGMRQKLGIAQAIMEDQDILVLDEPFNALDFRTHEDTKDLLRLLHAEGRTILLTSHNYEDIESLCTQVYILDNGSLQAALPEDEMRKRFRG